MAIDWSPLRVKFDLYDTLLQREKQRQEAETQKYHGQLYKAQAEKAQYETDELRNWQSFRTQAPQVQNLVQRPSWYRDSNTPRSVSDDPWKSRLFDAKSRKYDQLRQEYESLNPDLNRQAYPDRKSYDTAIALYRQKIASIPREVDQLTLTDIKAEDSYLNQGKRQEMAEKIYQLRMKGEERQARNLESLMNHRFAQQDHMAFNQERLSTYNPYDMALLKHQLDAENIAKTSQKSLLNILVAQRLIPQEKAAELLNGVLGGGTLSPSSESTWYGGSRPTLEVKKPDAETGLSRAPTIQRVQPTIKPRSERAPKPQPSPSYNPDNVERETKRNTPNNPQRMTTDKATAGEPKEDARSYSTKDPTRSGAGMNVKKKGGKWRSMLEKNGLL